MARLIVFIGKPGVGKTTLIESVFSDSAKIDVMHFVKKYEQNGIVSEEKTILGYQEMYKHLEQLKSNQDIVLELGTNHAGLNIKKLLSLSQSFSILIFLCVAPIDVCRDRAINRDRYFQQDALEKRLLRNFPESHKELLNHRELQSIELNTSQNIPSNISKIKSCLNKNI